MRSWLPASIKWRVLLPLMISLPLGVGVAAIPTAASAALCNTVAQNSWAGNCTEQQGDGSTMVQAIQATVMGWDVANGYPCASINIDSAFGSATTTAVKCYQRNNGLMSDGVVGPSTWASLQGLLKHQTTDGNWVYYDTFHHPTYPWFRQWAPSGIWYVEGSAGSGTYTQMTWG
jgi:hypothetical protein